MTNPHVHFHLNTVIDQYQSQVMMHIVTIRIDTIVHTTRQETLLEIHRLLPRRLHLFNLINSDLQQIYETFCHQGLSHMESEFLASYIAPIATNNQFGVQMFDIKFLITLTGERVNRLTSNYLALQEEIDVLGRLLRDGGIDVERSRRLDLDSGTCPICLDNISGTLNGVRTSCSHVFHYRCIMEWLHENNSCPFCRRILYRI